MKRHSIDRRTGIRIFGVIITMLALVVILPQAAALRDSLTLLRGTNPVALVLAALCMTLTFCFAALNYHLLARKPLKYHRSVFVAMANMFTNRLLPAGAGSIATFYLYLRRNKHTVTQAGSVIAVNNLLGIIAHILLLLGLVAYTPESFSKFQPPPIPAAAVGGIIILIGLIVFLVMSNESMQRKFRHNINRIKKHIFYYRFHPVRMVGVLGSAGMITTLNAAVLWFCCLAIGVSISPVIALIVFTAGIVVGTLTPTPGGLGGAEAGLLTALVAFGVAASSALAAVVLYRLISYWLTLAVGAGVYAYISKRGYLYSNRT